MISRRRVVFALDSARMLALGADSADALALGCREVLERGTRTVEVSGPALEEEAGAVLKAHFSGPKG